MGHGELIDSMLAEGLTCAIESCHMGITAEEIATRYKISRADQDAFAAQSQQRAERALGDGASRRKWSPSRCRSARAARSGSTPTSIRGPGVTAEKLAGLKPAFKKDGSVTAGECVGHQ